MSLAVQLHQTKLRGIGRSDSCAGDVRQGRGDGGGRGGGGGGGIVPSAAGGDDRGQF